MTIPAYLWLKDDGGADIKGSVDVNGREGSIETLAISHDVSIPNDDNTGKLTGTRIHGERTHGPAGFSSEGGIILTPSVRRLIRSASEQFGVIR